jgi:hypothetical protein
MAVLIGALYDVFQSIQSECSDTSKPDSHFLTHRAIRGASPIDRAEIEEEGERLLWFADPKMTIRELQITNARTGSMPK